MDDIPTTSSRQPDVELDGFRFAMLPEALIYSDVSGVAVKVFAALLRHGADPRSCYPSHQRLAGLCRMSVATVRRAIGDLVAAGWVTVVHRAGIDGGQVSNGYRIHQTPLLTGEHPPLLTGEHPPCSPVSNEREPLNESKKNESAAEHESSSSRARTTSEDDDDDDDGGSDPLEELHQAALARGWTSDQVLAARAKAACKRDPAAYFVACLANMAADDPPATLDLDFGDLARLFADGARL